MRLLSTRRTVIPEFAQRISGTQPLPPKFADMTKSRLTPDQWAKARRLRAAGATFAVIGKEFGISASTIINRARSEVWPSPAGATRGKPTLKSAPLPADTAEARRGLMHRLYALMDYNLEMMELRMQKQLKEARKHARSNDGTLPAGVDEEGMRQLANTMKTIEQAKELDPDLHRSADGGARPEGARAGASEAEAFHREIAERLGKLIPPS